MDLFVSDLDGTLLNSDKVLSTYTVQSINSLIRKGALFTVATARSQVSAGKVINALELKLPQVYHNGAFIYDPQRGENIVAELIPSDDTAEILAVFRQMKINPILYTVKTKKQDTSIVPDTDKYSVYHCAPENAGEHTYLNDRLKSNDPRFKIVPDFNQPPFNSNEDTICIVAIQPEKILLPLVQEIRSRFHVAIHFAEDIYTTGFFWLEICHKAATKEHAGQFLKEYAGAERLICFGDHINDLPMFSIADEAYAVENGHEQIRSRANGIISSNDSDGVARYLEKRINTKTSEGLRYFESPREGASFVSDCLVRGESLELLNNILPDPDHPETDLTNSSRFYHFVFKPLRKAAESGQFIITKELSGINDSHTNRHFENSEWELDNFRVNFVKNNLGWCIRNIYKAR